MVATGQFLFDVSKSVLRKPTRNMPIERIWIAVTRRHVVFQFNVYKTGTGVYLTKQDENGESENLVHHKGGEFADLPAAYTKATDLVSDLMIGCGMLNKTTGDEKPTAKGPGDMTAVLIADITPHNPSASFDVAQLDLAGACITRQNRGGSCNAILIEAMIENGGAVTSLPLEGLGDVTPSQGQPLKGHRKVWLVVDDQGDSIGEFVVVKTAEEAMLEGKWLDPERSYYPRKCRSLHEALDSVVASAATQMCSSSRNALHIADISSSSKGALALCTIGRLEDGIYEYRRLDPESLAQVANSSARRVVRLDGSP